MKELKIIKKGDLVIKVEKDELGCDFCGGVDDLMFVSDKEGDTLASINPTICFNCVRQLNNNLE